MSPPEPPPTASPTYKALHATALAFLPSQSDNPSLPTRIDFPRLTALCTPTFTHSFGHAYFASLSPPHLHGALSLSAFTTHLASMLTRLETWEAKVSDVLVDETKREVMLRVSFYMRAKGVEEVVENELVWVLGMEEHEGEWKVCRSVEFVDGVAAGRLRELMMGGGK
jgi:hypothetical protein